jgi:anaerobic magnesium-protoporphyrin IX monomethyl ester cyclase
LPPLGLLAIGGPLIDSRHEVRLLDADRTNMLVPEIVAATVAWAPDAVLFGHSGSTSGHPRIAEVAGSVHRALPQVAIVYGGVFPTYHWQEILTAEPYVTAIVRGEGEETACRLMAALESGGSLAGIAGIAYSDERGPRATDRRQ